MYGLPESFDTTFLIGREVQSITYLAYQVNLYFDNKVWLQIEGGFELYQDGKSIEAVKEFPILQSSLLQLIERKIVDVSFVALSGDIQLRFESGHALRVVGDIGPYESYILFDGVKQIIV